MKTGDSFSAATSHGQQLGRYTLLKRLASGGMAELFIAKNSGISGFEKIVVLKRILPHLRDNEDFISMFLDEARIAANLEHPNIVNIYDIGRAGEDYFFTMAYLHGEDLSIILRRLAMSGRNMPLKVTLRVIMGTCAGLHYAHEQVGLNGLPLNIVHRDVSTTNVIVTHDGAIKVVDFGIAKAATQSKMTRAGVRKGKAAYMSPEQCRAEPLDRRSDIFAIGILLWEMTTGRSLFRTDNELATMNNIVHEETPRPSSVIPGYPPQLEAIVMRALARDRLDRYQTARGMQEDLEAFVRDHQLECNERECAAFMQELFGDKPLPWVRDPNKPGSSMTALIEPTNPNPTPHPASASSMSTKPGTGTVVAPPPQQPSRAQLIGLVAGLAVTAFGAGVGVMAWRGSGSDTAPSPPTEPPAEAKAADLDATPSSTSAGSCPEGMVLIEGRPASSGLNALTPFCLDRTEVTVADYHACSARGECKRAHRDSHWAPDEDPKAVTAFSSLCNEGRTQVDDHPINCVDWHQAQTYCDRRGARLPRGNEWEHAARGESQPTYPWGDDPPKPDRLNGCGSECLAWFRRSGLELSQALFTASDGHVETAPVGSFSGGDRPDGLTDLAGNVSEWTDDDLGTSNKTIRGGSFHSARPQQVSAAFRRGLPPDYFPHDVGFRCAADPGE